MQKMDIAKIRKKVILYISAAMAILFVLIIAASAYAKHYNQMQQEELFSKQVNLGIKHVLKHYVHDYDLRLSGLAENRCVADFIKKKDADGLKKLLNLEWQALQKAEANIEFMQIHLSDGTSLLQMHKPDFYEANLGDTRPMIKEVNTLHKFLDGYETQQYETLYRIIEPIFDKDGLYLGAIEIGLNHKFILDAVHQITGFEGIAFVQDSTVAGGYKLEYTLAPNLRKIYASLEKVRTLQTTPSLNVEGQKYKTHKIQLSDFQGVERVQLIFFQDITDVKDYRSYFLWLMFAFFGLVIVILVWLIHRRIGEYQDEVSAVYKQQIEELQEAKELLSQSQRIGHIGNWKFDFSTNKLLWSDEVYNIFELDKESYTPTYEGLLDLIYPEDRQTLQKLYEDSLENKTRFKIMHRFLSQDGTIKYIQEECEHFYDDAGKALFSIGTIVDVSQSYLDQKKLKEQEEMMIAQSRHAAMGEMISMIAHQWRQPISVISMDANNILADIELENLQVKGLKNNLEDIVSQTKHLSQTIDDFRDFFKPNKLKSQVLIPEVFEDALKIIEKSFQNNKIVLKNNFASTTKVTIYSRELQQVFINILKNAAEALMERQNKDKKITTSIYEEGNFMVIDICDNAGGIDSAIINSIFDPYFSTKDEKNGTGLGLYMSKIIVEKHLHGELKAVNIADGACFSLKIPREDIHG